MNKENKDISMLEKALVGIVLLIIITLAMLSLTGCSKSDTQASDQRYNQNNNPDQENRMQNRDRFRNLTQEERDAMAAGQGRPGMGNRFQNMTQEEREAMFANRTGPGNRTWNMTDEERQRMFDGQRMPENNRP